MMLAVAAVAAVFGAFFNAPWLIPLIIITAPQTIIVAACAFQAVREGKSRKGHGTKPDGNLSALTHPSHAAL
jgi:hypothetical protein